MEVGRKYPCDADAVNRPRRGREARDLPIHRGYAPPAMWMLLEPSARKSLAPKASRDSVRAHDARENGTRVRATTKSSLLEYLGSAAAAQQPGGAAAPVTVFLHPGRAPVGRVGVERVFDQFACVLPRVYATIEEAEACHAADVGFLLEVTRPFVDPRGDRHAGGVLFATSVRD